MTQLWRVVGMEPWGTGDLEIGELQMWAAGSRVDVGATISASVAPFSGTLANLADGDATTRAVFSAAQQRGVLSITYDMGVAVPDVDQIKLGLGLTKAKSLRRFSLEKYESGVWVDASFNCADGVRIGSITFTVAEDLVSVARFTPSYLRILFTRWVYNNSAISHGVRESDSATGVGQTRLQEVQYVDRAGVVHPTSPMTSNTAPSPFVVSASSAETGSGYPEWLAFDGVTGSDSSRWIGALSYVGDQHLTIQLDQEIELRKLRLCADGAVSIGYYLLSFVVLGSTTGVFAGEERILHRVTNDGAWSNNTFRDFDVQGEGAALGTEYVALAPATFDAGSDEMPGLFEFENPALTFFKVGSELLNNNNVEGDGEILGTVKIEADPTDDSVPDIPVRRLVRLHRDLDGMLVKSTYSDPVTGAYAFRNVSRAFTYHALAFDNTHSYRLVGADGIAPTLMT